MQVCHRRVLLKLDLLLDLIEKSITLLSIPLSLFGNVNSLLFDLAHKRFYLLLLFVALLIFEHWALALLPHRT